MEKINIAELLRDCPSGMELDCTMYEDVYFDYVDELNIIHCYIQHETHKTSIPFNQHGTYNSNIKSKCVIFPKGKTTWEGFQRPFKDGDVLATNDGSFISIIKKNGGKYYCCCNSNGTYFVTDYSGWFDRLATEEEKQKLFNAIKANDYRWNEETKTLEKLPRFRVGDRIKEGEKIATIVRIYKDFYDIRFDSGGKIGSFTIDLQDNWELVPNKFDINTLKPFDKVLVKDNDIQKWCISFFSHCNGLEIYKYSCINGCGYAYCIPYENNEHLLDTTNDCDDFYKTW